MFKQRFIVVFVSFLLLSVHSKAQKFIPSEVTVNSFSGTYSVNGLKTSDVFKVSPDFNWIDDIYLPKEDYFFGSYGNENGYSIDLGFRLNSFEKAKASTLLLGFGKTSGFGFSAVYNFEDYVPVDTFYRNGEMLIVDSISDISSQARFTSTSIFNLRFGFQKEVIQHKKWTLGLGILSQISFYSQSQSSFLATSFYTYQFKTSYNSVRQMSGDGLYSWSKEEQNPFSFSLMLPISIECQLSDSRNILENTSIVLSGVVGKRFISHPQLPFFNATFARYSFGVKYNFN